MTVEEDQLRQRIIRATSALRKERWTVDELRPLAELLESSVNARRRIDAVGNVAWLADRRGGRVMGRLHVLAGAFIAAGVMLAPAAHADPAGNAICRLLAAGNTPDGLESSVTMRQVLGPDATNADARVYIRSVVAGQCPQYLWRF